KCRCALTVWIPCGQVRTGAQRRGGNVGHLDSAQPDVMGFDYSSLLMASGAAGVALCFTLASSWARQRRSSFLLTWAIGIAFIIASIVGFSAFHASGKGWHAIVAGV